jgi:hypothetical protein
MARELELSDFIASLLQQMKESEFIINFPMALIKPGNMEVIKIDGDYLKESYRIMKTDEQTKEELFLNAKNSIKHILYYYKKNLEDLKGMICLFLAINIILIEIDRQELKREKRKQLRQRKSVEKRIERSKIKTFIRISRPQPGIDFEGVKKVWEKKEEEEEEKKEEEKKNSPLDLEWEEEILFQIKK